MWTTLAHQELPCTCNKDFPLDSYMKIPFTFSLLLIESIKLIVLRGYGLKRDLVMFEPHTPSKLPTSYYWLGMIRLIGLYVDKAQTKDCGRF